MITDSIQNPQWLQHLPNDGSKIGGDMPAKYGVVQPVPSSTAALVFIEGGAYSDFEAYVTRPALPNTGLLTLNYTLTTDRNAPVMAQAIETDTILTVNGWTYNLSAQLNYEEGGHFQVANESGTWIDSGCVPGKLSPDVPHKISIQYHFSQISRTSSVLSVTVDDSVYPLPLSLGNIPARQRGWSDGAIFQLQLDLGASGGAYSVLIDEASYVWQ